MGTDSVQMAEGHLKHAKQVLEAAKRDRDTAKKNGNYQSSAKVYRNNKTGKLGNIYDNVVWTAERSVQERKQQLADAKKRSKK